MKTYLHYPMKNLANCRDLGGLPTSDGGVTRFGVLIRSELPSGLAQEDIEMFRELGVTTSIDLRGDEEVKNNPSDLSKCEWIDFKHVNVLSRQAAVGSEVKKPAPRRDPDELFTMDWRDIYCGILDNKPKWVYEIFDAVANAPGAVHFHCATGKDRTGLFAMLMLSACGVSDADIAANYSLSEIYLRPFYIGMVSRLEGSKFGADDIDRGFFSTSHNIMRYVLEKVNEKHGSVINYIRDCGVSDEMIEKIRAKLIEY